MERVWCFTYTQKLIDRALYFYTILDKNFKVFPTGRGSIQFEKEVDDKYLEFEVYCDKITMLFQNSTEYVEATSTFKKI